MTSITTYSSDEESLSPTPDTTMLNSPETVKCGPKSWKLENELDMGSDEELAQIFEGREGDIPEAFGRIDGVTTQVNKVSEIDQGSYPIQNNDNMSSRRSNIYNALINNVVEKNTIRIPNKGPDRQSLIGLVRSVAEGHKGNRCALCTVDYCQEQAGRQWYPLFGWKFCHQKCWVRLCENYHQHLEEYGNKNTTLDFIYFVPVPN